MPDAAADQRPRRRHGDAGAFARHRQQAAVADGSERVVEIAGNDRHARIVWVGPPCAKWGLAAVLPTLATGQKLENKDFVQTLREKLAAGRFVITAEIAPPATCDAAELLQKALPLKGLADAVNVTDGAGARAHLSAVTAASILLQAGIEPILQFTCRDRNRIALQSDLLAAAALGIRNLLLLKGDDPKAGDQPDAKPVFDYDTVALTKVAVAIRDQGVLPSGRKVSGKAEFFIAAADVPIDPPAGWAPKSLLDKIAAGSEFVQTQFCMDAGVARRYMARLAEHGVKLPFLIGISPLRSAKSAHWMRDKLFGTIIPDATIARLEASSDPAAEGRRLCLELMTEVADIPGVAGVHIMAPGNESAIADVIRDAAEINLRA
jgi:methylenetetrahydrofolate reductase (NADPH)